MSIQPEQFSSRSLRQSPRGDDICHLLSSALKCANAGTAVRNYVSLDGDRLILPNKEYDLRQYQRMFIVGAGKAAVPMAQALCEILNQRKTDGLIITKKGYRGSELDVRNLPISVYEASHPIPDPSNLDASQKLIALVSKLKRSDLVFCLLSGGGSALLTVPAPGLALADLQVMTGLLLSCGADITEINTIRKHLDLAKGGNLAKLIYPASMISLILSDVVGDSLEAIASGPTAADPTTYRDAWKILAKYQLIDQIPPPVHSYIKDGIDAKRPETLKPDNPLFSFVNNVIIGSNTQAALAAQRIASDLGFHTRLLTTSLQGEASQVGKSIGNTAKSMFSSSDLSLPACLIAGGETTVTLRGTGMGGRNQELVLGAVESLSGSEPILLVSLATDGGDGPTDAAGAVATNRTYAEGLSLGLNPTEYLENNDAYHYFERLGDLIKTGPTLTNVNDLIFSFSW